jgi:hypothetical protein
MLQISLISLSNVESGGVASAAGFFDFGGDAAAHRSPN